MEEVEASIGIPEIMKTDKEVNNYKIFLNSLHKDHLRKHRKLHKTTLFIK